MKICFFADGISEHTRRWVTFFADQGHSVDLITWNEKCLPGYGAVRVHIIQKPLKGSSIMSRIGNLPLLLMKVRKLVREIGPDVLHAHSLTSYAWMAFLSGFRPYVVTPWGTDINIDINNSRISKLLSVMSVKSAGAVLCDADFIRQKAIDLGVNKAKVKVIMFGVDLRRVPKGKIRDEELLKRYSISSGPIVISTRILTKIRDVETFVRAAPLVLRSLGNVTFVVVGGGPERQYLESLAREGGYSGNVRFIGHVTEEEMVRWLAMSDLYVSTSLTDAGLAASTAEAMACGLPVISSDNSENSLWVEDGKGGFLYPNGNADKLAEFMVKLLSDEDARRKFGAHNAEIIRVRNNYHTEMEKVGVIYQELCKKSQA